MVTETTEPVEVILPEKLLCLFQPKRFKAVYSGRGCAKSHTFATILLIMGQKKPLRILCAREIQKSIKDSVKQLLDDKIKALGMEDFYDSTETEIKGANGTLFIFSGLGKTVINQVKSKEGIDIVWVEEAQTVSKESMEILVPTIRDAGSEAWFSWNPRHPTDPIDKMFRGLVTPEDSIIIRLYPKDNPYWTDVLQKTMEFDEKSNPDRYAHIWLGEYEPMAIGAIWDRQVIHENRRNEAPEMDRILVSVDPAVSSEEGANEHGIIVAGLGSDGRGYVLDDYTTQGTPRKWAQRAVAAYDRYEADGIVIEINQGGDMVRHTLEGERPGIRIIEVRASRGKHVRAEPISALYHAGRISHIGSFAELETQLCQFTNQGYEGEGSPDRADALVWAFTELMPQIVRKTDNTEPEFSMIGGEAGWMA